MEGIIKVTPSDLRAASQAFSGTSSQVQQLTGQMVATVDSLKSTWQGEASDTYSRKFHELENDIQLLHNMITEHATELETWAQNYEKTEQANAELGGALSGDVIQ